MAWRSGSLSRSLISTASRAASSPSSPSIRISSIPRSTLRSLNPSSSSPRRSLFSIPRNVAALGCAQSLMPLHSAVATARLTAHISAETRAFCELSQGT